MSNPTPFTWSMTSRVTWLLWPSKIIRCRFVDELPPFVVNASIKCPIHYENKTNSSNIFLHGYCCKWLTKDIVVSSPLIFSENVKVKNNFPLTFITDSIVRYSVPIGILVRTRFWCFLVNTLSHSFPD